MDQEYVPTSKVYYQPTNQGYEETIQKRIEFWNRLRAEARAKEPSKNETDSGEK